MSNADAPTPPDPGPNPDGVTPAPYAPTDPYAAPVPAADAAPPVAGRPTASWSSASASALYPGTEVPGAGSGYPQGPGAYPIAAPLAIRPTRTYPGPAARRRDGVSIGALVTGLLGMSLIAVVLGIVGLRRTRANGTDGRGMAIAGIVLGGLSFVAWAILGPLVTVGVSAQDRRINGLREACAAGEMGSCDSLAITAEWGSEDKEFGKTCGGLTDGTFLCSSYEPRRWAQGDDAELGALRDACASGDGTACRDLAVKAPLLSDDEEFGMTCGGTREPSYLSCP